MQNGWFGPVPRIGTAHSGCDVQKTLCMVSGNSMEVVQPYEIQWLASVSGPSHETVQETSIVYTVYV